MNDENNASAIDEAITVVPYDPAWPRLYDAEEARVRGALGAAVVAIEHVGSTSVPGLAAKPIVDLLVGVRALPPSPVDRAALERLGYVYLGEAGVPGRHAFRARHPRPFNLAVVRPDGPVWRDNLLIRDYLRAHPAEARRYAAEKRAALAAGAVTLLAYSEHKRAFMQDLLDRAQAWSLSGR